MCSINLLWFCVVATLCCNVASGFAIESSLRNVLTSKNQSDSLPSIVKFLEEQEEKLQFSKQKDVVLVLGNVRSGKTTLTSLLTDVDLEAIETFDGSEEFVFIDKKKIESMNIQRPYRKPPYQN